MNSDAMKPEHCVMEKSFICVCFCIVSVPPCGKNAKRVGENCVCEQGFPDGDPNVECCKLKSTFSSYKNVPFDIGITLVCVII